MIEANMIEDRREGGMLVGINYPWIDYGWDFGDPPPAWVDPQNATAWREKKRKQMGEDFRAFADMGLFAVRWFMLADGLSYGVGDEAPRMVNGEWAFDPLAREHPFHQQLYDDFEFVLKTCRDLRIKFVPSLIDFHWCHQGTIVDANSRIVKGGRADIISDKAKRIAFLDHVLDPLLDLSLQYPEAIYAWELINEPEWVTKPQTFLSFFRDQNKTVSFEQMCGFIAAGIERINSRRLADGRRAFHSTVGFAHWDAIGSWDSVALGVSLHQYHYYAPDKREIPGYDYPANQQSFIGEFATKFHRGWPDLKDGDKERTIAARLSWVERKGYPAAFLWSARATDEATAWTENDREQTISFITRPRDEVA